MPTVAAVPADSALADVSTWSFWLTATHVVAVFATSARSVIPVGGLAQLSVPEIEVVEAMANEARESSSIWVAMMLGVVWAAPLVVWPFWASTGLAGSTLRYALMAPAAF